MALHFFRRFCFPRFAGVLQFENRSGNPFPNEENMAFVYVLYDYDVSKCRFIEQKTVSFVKVNLAVTG